MRETIQEREERRLAIATGRKCYWCWEEMFALTQEVSLCGKCRGEFNPENLSSIQASMQYWANSGFNPLSPISLRRKAYDDIKKKNKAGLRLVK